MNEQIERIIDEGFSALLLVVALSVFFITNNSVKNYMESFHTMNRMHTEQNDYSSYNHSVLGADVIATILNDNNGVDFTVYTIGEPPIHTVDCNLISELSTIDETGTYSVSYSISGSAIDSITYTQ